jgi:exodeoxyribonuclease-3
MKIVSYNVNGIRAAIKKGFVEWLSVNDFDIVCIQETKANEDQVDTSGIKALGYEIYWFGAEKKGYSGVAVFSRIKPLKHVLGQNNEKFDFEGRTLQLDFDNFTLINTYFPSGSSGDLRQEFKYEFLDEYFKFIKEKQAEGKKLIVVGDYNICHLDIDIHNPTKQQKTSGFLPKERAWMYKWFGNDMIDSFRKVKGDSIDKYSWWSYRANSRNNNKGWRIDYISVSKKLDANIKDADILSEVKHSDHCPVYLEIEF